MTAKKKSAKKKKQTLLEQIFNPPATTTELMAERRRKLLAEYQIDANAWTEANPMADPSSVLYLGTAIGHKDQIHAFNDLDRATAWACETRSRVLYPVLSIELGGPEHGVRELVDDDTFQAYLQEWKDRQQ